MLPVFPGQKHWYQVKSLYMISQKIKFVCTNIADTAIGVESKLMFGMKISLLWASRKTEYKFWCRNNEDMKHIYQITFKE